MPALFGYLFSLLVFIGGGYAGLVWLTELPPKAISAPLTMATAARLHSHQGRSKAMQSSAADKAEIAHIGALPAVENNVAPAKDLEESDPASERKERPTDYGENQEGSDKEDPLARDNAPAQNALASGETGIALDRNVPFETVDNGNAALKNVGGVTAGSPAAAQINANSSKDSRIRSAHYGNSRPRKQAKREFKLEDRHDRDRKTIQPSRAGLVMMTLQTIEFSDGHREERLLPIRHSWADND